MLNYPALGVTPRQALQLRLSLEITQTAHRWHSVFAEARRAEGKGSPRISLLYFLAAAPKGLTQTELADQLEISAPSLTRQLDKLEALGLVSRRRMLGDGRMRLIFMEPAGRDALLALEVKVSALRDRVFEGISEADMETAQRVLERLSSRLAADPGLASDA